MRSTRWAKRTKNRFKSSFILMTTTLLVWNLLGQIFHAGPPLCFQCLSFRIPNLLHGVDKKKRFGLFKIYFVYFPQYFHMNIISSPLSIWPKCDIKQHLHLFWWFKSPKFISIKKKKKYFFKKFSKTSKNMSKMTVN